MYKYIMFPLLAFSVVSTNAFAVTTSKMMNFTYRNEDIVKMMDDYSKASGQKIILDPQVRGKATVLNSGPVTVEEAFNQLSTAMMVNGLAFSRQGDTLVALQARSAQRNMIDVVTELPPQKPEKMVAWMIKLKHVSADEVNKQLRILTSANGELVPYTHTNHIIVSDYVSNLHRIAAILKELDQPAGSKTSKAN